MLATIMRNKVVHIAGLRIHVLAIVDVISLMVAIVYHSVAAIANTPWLMWESFLLLIDLVLPIFAFILLFIRPPFSLPVLLFLLRSFFEHSCNAALVLRH